MILIYVSRKGPAQAQVTTDIFHDALRRETSSDTRICVGALSVRLPQMSEILKVCLKQCGKAK